MSRAHRGPLVAIGCVGVVLVPMMLAAQTPPAPTATNGAGSSSASAPASAATNVTPPADYVIGPDDVLGIVFWREKDLSADVVVRPDGMITLPLLEDIRVVGLTPAELKQKVEEAAGKLVTSPHATVIVKQINSRKVFITGHVARPGAYALTTPTTVVQLIALAGGLLEFADRSKIQVMRKDKQGLMTFRVNYKQLEKGEDLKQNIELRPGDTVIVP